MKGKTYKDREIAQFAAQAGFRGPQLVLAVAVALGETDGRNIYNRICCYGLWQIHARAHGHSNVNRLYDPLFNAREAFRISGGGRNWQPWEAYTNGRYKRYEGRAKRAVSAMSGGGLSPDEIVDAGTSSGPVDDVLNAADAIGDTGATIGQIADYLTDGGIWARVAFVLLGAILLIVGITFVGVDIGLGSKTLRRVSRVIPGGIGPRL